MKKPPSHLRFTHIRLVNWRNFLKAEASLGGRAFFVGPNASGKSNLLDAFRFLRDLVKPVGGGFVSAVEARNGISAIRCLQARGRNSYVEIDVSVGNDEEPALWSYRIRFTKVGREPFATIAEEDIKLRGETIKLQKRGKDDVDFLPFTQTLLQQASTNIDFRDLVTFFASIRYLHVVPQIVRDPRRSLDDKEDPFGGDLLKRISETNQRTRESRLKRIAQALSIAVPQFVDLKLDQDSEGRPHLKAGFKHWRPNPSYQTEEVFSDGTLRLIGFLWSLSENEGPLLLEEPELSLHADVVRQLPSMMHRTQRHKSRQIIVTTHSDAMVDSEGIGLNEVFILKVGDIGTTIESGIDDNEIVEQVRGGFTLAEAVMPKARPRDITQLSFIGEL
ncbi:ATP-binding protein [Aquibium sp. ELW1220]|uniref:AAA family ATPase n=1 Tax=Aquibium sp. ELW1220 TaxID=2976766 RepID=UPI0025B10102|nr:ATP-binding protein [Aquibium sp. ELW1220]MDN2579249.1 AAA family ATPase [Aquibium sp. ELW1220]